MKPTSILIVTSMALAAPLQADPYGAPKPRPEAAGPKLVKVKIVPGQCSTDGGAQACPLVVKWFGDALQRKLNQELGDSAMACTGDKPGTPTIRLGYEYNDGTVDVLDGEKVQAKWPQCARDFAAGATGTMLRLHKRIFDIDPAIDLRYSFAVTLTIKK